jgi:plasmid stability protein
MAKHRRSPVTKLLGSLSDDTKELLDDLAARTKSVEEHARDAVRGAVAGDECPAECDRQEIDELRKALARLTEKVNRLAAEPGGPGEGRCP